MSFLKDSCFSTPVRLAAAPLILSACAAWLQLHARDALSETREATQFSVPSGSPDESMQSGAAFAAQLDPEAEISFRGSQSGSLSVTRIEGDRLKCIVRIAPDATEALKPLGRFLSGRIDPAAQILFAFAHEIGHCKLREAFMKRVDGRVADASALPWLAQEAAADVYGILSVERRLGEKVPVRQAVVIARMLVSSMYHDASHATGHYVSDALGLCRKNRADADAVQCAISTAYYVVGSQTNDERGSPYSVDSPPKLLYELGVEKMSRELPVYDDIEQYKAKFSGADLRPFAFNQVSHQGNSRYITAATTQRTDMAYRLADFYGFKTGELVLGDRRKVAVLRIDGVDELDWLLTLGAVVRGEDGESLRKGASAPGTTLHDLHSPGRG